MNLKNRLSLAFNILRGKAVSRNIDPGDVIVPLFYDKYPQWNTWSGEKAVKEGYKANVWVYRCVSTLASLASSVPWVVYRRQRGEGSKPWVPVEGHDLELLLQKPNPFFSGQDLFELLTAHLNLDGNGYWLINEVRGKPVELWPVLPFQMAPVPSKDNFLEGYVYRNNGREIRLIPQAVTHFKFFDPGNLWVGMAPLQAAARTVDTDNEALDWNKVSLQNRAVTDGVFLYRGQPGTMTEANWRMAIKLVSEQWQGRKNNHKPMVLSEFDYKDMAKTPVEMDFIEGRKMNREEICAAFKVPPIVVGILDNASYSNYDQALKALWTLTIIPYLEDLRSGINLDITPRFGDDLKVDFDISEVDALNENVNEKWTRLFGAIDRGMLTINEAREEMGFDPIEGGDIALIPINRIPLNSSGAEQQPQNQPSPDQNTPAEQNPMPDGEQNVKKNFCPVCGGIDDEFEAEIKGLPLPNELKAFGIETEEQKSAYWRTFERARMQWYPVIQKQVAEQFEKEKNAVLKAIPNTDDGDKVENAVKKVVEGQKKDWIKLFTAFYIAVMEDFGKKVEDGFKSSVGPTEKKEEPIFDVWAEEIQKWITAEVGKKIVSIDATTLELILPNIREAIAKGVEEGEGIPEITKRVKAVVEEKYKGFGDYRARRISRTEVVASSNKASLETARMTNLDLNKVWVATRDSRVRPAHAAAEGQTRAIDEDFDVGGEKLPYPGGGSIASNNVHCRCCLLYKKK